MANYTEQTGNVIINVESNKIDLLPLKSGNKTFYAAVKKDNTTFENMLSEQNVTVEISQTGNWCKVNLSPSEDNTAKLINYECDENTGTSNRTATIKFNCNDTESTNYILIIQQGVDEPIDDPIEDEPKALLSLPEKFAITVVRALTTDINDTLYDFSNYYDGVSKTYGIEQPNTDDLDLKDPELSEGLVVPDLPELPDLPENNRCSVILAIFLDASGIKLTKPVDFDIIIKMKMLTNYYDESTWNNDMNKFFTNSGVYSNSKIYGESVDLIKYYSYATNICTEVKISAGSLVAEQSYSESFIDMLNGSFQTYGSITNDKKLKDVYFPTGNEKYNNKHIPCAFNTPNNTINLTDSTSDFNKNNIHDTAVFSKPLVLVSVKDGNGFWNPHKTMYENAMYEISKTNSSEDIKQDIDAKLYRSL